MPPKTVAADDDTLKNLLDESKEYMEEGKKQEDTEAVGGVTSWYQNFNERLSSLSLDDFSQKMKSNLTTLRVRISPRQEEEDVDENTRSQREVTTGQDIKDSESFNKKFNNLQAESKATFRSNVLLKVIRRIQKLVHNHGYALEFLQHLINKLEERVHEVERKVAGVDLSEEWIKKEITDEVESKLDELKVKVDGLEAEKEALKLEVDTTRQWGLKGNIVITTLKEEQSMLEPKVMRGQKESEVKMCLRLVEEKTGVWLQESDILACHPMGKPGKKSYILKIHNHKSDSGWEALTAGIMSGRHSGEHFVRNGVFLNFQLTERRQGLLHNVREARKARPGQIKKYKVDPNGRIWVSQEKGQAGVKSRLPWKEVTDYSSLKELCPGMDFPVVREERQGGRVNQNLRVGQSQDQRAGQSQGQRNNQT